MSKFVVSRDNVQVGLLKYIYNEETINNSSEEQMTRGCKICRAILFEVNEEGLANDLIFTTPTNYNIEGITGARSTKSPFIIVNSVSLSEFLKYTNYGEELTQYDLYFIFKNLIIRNKLLEQYKGIFGWRKAINKNEYIVVPNSKLPMEMYEKLKSISNFGNGVPSELEPQYKHIKRKVTK